MSQPACRPKDQVSFCTLSFLVDTPLRYVLFCGDDVILVSWVWFLWGLGFPQSDTALQAPLRDAMVERGLADPELLACYPRTDYRQLDLLPVEFGVVASSSSSISPCISPCLLSGTHGILRHTASTGFDPQTVSLN